MDHKKRGTGRTLFLISCLLVSLALIVTGGRTLYIKYCARNWKAVTGQITELIITRAPTGTYLQYTPHIKYTYFIGSNQYDSEKDLPEEIDIRTIERKFARGKPVEVFYNPHDQGDSLLFRDIGPRDVSLLIYGTVLFLIMLPLCRQKRPSASLNP